MIGLRTRPMFHFVVCAHMEWIVLEREGMFEVGEFLIAEAGRLAERPGRATQRTAEFSSRSRS